MSEDLFDGKPVIHFDDPRDRRSFLRYAAIIGVGGTLAAACGTGGTSGGSSTSTSTSASASTSSQFGEGDLGILNYALTLEHLEAEFYAKGTAAGILGPEAAFINPIAQHEAAHVQALTQTIQKMGGTPAKKPTFNFPAGTFSDKSKFLSTAMTFEETGVKAYHGQVTKIKDKNVLGAAASIAGVESRHAAVIHDILGQKQVPSPVEANAPMSDILTAIKPFLAGS